MWHQNCFVCAQCFRPFTKDAIFYEFEGRKYCEHDFHVLFAPCCVKCSEFIIGKLLPFTQVPNKSNQMTIHHQGRVIKAMNANWHPGCFKCELCQDVLTDKGFFKNAGRALCQPCNDKEKAAAVGKYTCFKCRATIDDGTPLKFKVMLFLVAYIYICILATVANRILCKHRARPTIRITLTASRAASN